MSITLLCLVKGNTLANAFPVDINKDQLVGHLKEAIKVKKQNDFAGVDADKLKLWKVMIPSDQDDQLRNLILQNSDELLAINDIGDYWPTPPPKKHIHIIVKLPLLSLEEALSCILPSITYSTDCVTSKTTTKAVGDPLASVQLWDNFFDKVNSFHFDQQPRFERLRFVMKKVLVDEEDVRSVLDFNICQILNKLMGPDCVYSRRPTDTPGIPDFNCHLIDRYIVHFIKKEGRISKSRKCKVRITELEAENAELRKENTEIHDLRIKLSVSDAKIAELKRRNNEFLRANAEYNERRNAENAKLKAEKVEFRDRLTKVE
ncbi:kinase-like domain-containing protein [Rhizophagus irregularis DAOM 181602=DAOM 197198]|nr:kinase-like domain-containing protein [Rhizophagus irregularis DAOM 181602=DAOM 197198]